MTMIAPEVDLVALPNIDQPPFDTGRLRQITVMESFHPPNQNNQNAVIKLSIHTWQVSCISKAPRAIMPMGSYTLAHQQLLCCI
jgi:hypothetical protein